MYLTLIGLGFIFLRPKHSENHWTKTVFSHCKTQFDLNSGLSFQTIVHGSLYTCCFSQKTEQMRYM